MRTFFRAAAGALLSLSVVAGLPAAAYAAGAPCQHVQQTSGNGYGLLNNLQLAAPISLGLGISDNALGLLGYGSANRTGGDTNTCG